MADTIKNQKSFAVAGLFWFAFVYVMHVLNPSIPACGIKMRFCRGEAR